MGRAGYHKTWNYFIDVTLNEIAEAYGSSIYDKRCGKSWDVGQAVCAEQFGVDWMDSDEFHRIGAIPPDQPIDLGITAAAQRLLDGVRWCDKLKEA